MFSVQKIVYVFLRHYYSKPIVVIDSKWLEKLKNNFCTFQIPRTRAIFIHVY